MLHNVMKLRAWRSAGHSTDSEAETRPSVDAVFGVGVVGALPGSYSPEPTAEARFHMLHVCVHAIVLCA